MKIRKTTIVLLAILAVVIAGTYIFSNTETLRIKVEAEQVSKNTTYLSEVNVKQQKSFESSELNRDKFPNYVVDPYGQLEYFTGHLGRMAKSWEKELGIEVNVLIASQSAGDISRFAEQLFQVRRIGENFPTGGILVLIDPVNKEARIEVSYSLEGILTDAYTGLIAKNQLAPYASYSIVGMSILDTFHFLKDYIYIQSIKGNLVLDKQYTDKEDYQSKLDYLSGGGGAESSIGDLSFDRDLKKAVPAEQLYKYQPSNDLLKTVESYSNSLRDLIGFPDLPLFTESSRILRKHYPLAPFETISLYRKIEDSKPFVVYENGDYAVVSSNSPAHGFVPILLKKADNIWQVDLSETWKNMFFDGNGNYYQKNNNNPYAFGLSQFGKGKEYGISALEVNPGELEQRIVELQNKGNGYSDFLAAELLFRNAFAALEALRNYESAARKSPQDNFIQSVVADRYVYLGFAEPAISIYRKLGPIAQLKLANAYAAAERFGEVEETAKAVLKRNPYSKYALRWLKWSLKKQKKFDEASKVQQQLESLLADKSLKWKLVWLTFTPTNPLYHPEGTRKVGNVDVYGHSEFSVTMTNHSNRAVEIDSLRLYSKGAGGAPSGLGDIRSYFNNHRSPLVLAPMQSISFDKVWGFVVDPGHDRLSYIFDLCWHGVNGDDKQCEAQQLDLITKDDG